MQPVLAVTRQLPEAVAKRAAQSYDIRTQEGDDPLSRNEILALCHGADAALVSVGDPIDATFLKNCPTASKLSPPSRSGPTISIWPRPGKRA